MVTTDLGLARERSERLKPAMIIEKDKLPMCNQAPRVPTEEEEQIHRQLLEIKAKVRSLKEGLNKCKETGDLIMAGQIEEELKGLKQIWSDLQIKRSEAAKRRMKLLGYGD